jgi:protein TonB
MRRGFTVVSIVVHTIVVGAALVAEVTAVGPLPMPRTPVTFDVTRIQLADIKLPAPPRAARAGAAAAPAGAPIAAPLDAPSSVRPETGFENQAPQIIDAVSVARGLDSGLAFGGTEQVPPPPPPPTQRSDPAPVRLSSLMQPPRKLVDVAPVYPPLAQRAYVQGTVILEAIIDARGHVSEVHVLRSIPLLDQAAVDAVRQWVYTPTVFNGRAIPIVMTVTVQFTLQGR